MVSDMDTEPRGAIAMSFCCVLSHEYNLCGTGVTAVPCHPCFQIERRSPWSRIEFGSDSAKMCYDMATSKRLGSRGRFKKLEKRRFVFVLISSKRRDCKSCGNFEELPFQLLFQGWGEYEQFRDLIRRQCTDSSRIRAQCVDREVCNG